MQGSALLKIIGICALCVLGLSACGKKGTLVAPNAVVVDDQEKPSPAPQNDRRIILDNLLD